MTASVPLVSVVTPVYNEERHLPECIESVLAQTYENWDYIIVDNCSTDSSLEIARRYAAKDSRIRVMQNREFLTQLQNCNAAVRQISPDSKYCKVVFGDDWIFPECLDRMVALAEAYPSVGIVGAYAMEGTALALAGLPYDAKVVSGREACRRHLLDREYVFGTQTSVLYRSDLVRSHDPLYNESNAQADTETCFALLRESDFGFVHQVLTYTRVRAGSLNMVSLEMETSLAAILHLLTTYGASYLTAEELRARLDEHMFDYYRLLAKSVLLRRDAKFWKYHKSQLAATGRPLSSPRVAFAMLRYLAERLARIVPGPDPVRRTGLRGY